MSGVRVRTCAKFMRRDICNGGKHRCSAATEVHFLSQSLGAVATHFAGRRAPLTRSNVVASQRSHVRDQSDLEVMSDEKGEMRLLDKNMSRIASHISGVTPR